MKSLRDTIASIPVENDELNFLGHFVTPGFADALRDHVFSRQSHPNHHLDVAVQIGYIDKSPIIDFTFSRYPKNIELADMLINVEREFCSLTSEASYRFESRAFFLQAKTTSKLPFKCSGPREQKQLQVLLNWLCFELVRPVLKHFRIGDRIDVHLPNKRPGPLGGLLLIKRKISDQSWNTTSNCVVLEDPANSTQPSEFEDFIDHLTNLYSSSVGELTSLGSPNDDWSKLVDSLLDRKLRGFYSRQKLQAEKIGRVQSSTTKFMESAFFQKHNMKLEKPRGLKTSICVHLFKQKIKFFRRFLPRPLVVIKVTILQAE